VDYYEDHPDLFKNDSCKSFMDCRLKVARKLYLTEHADSLNAFFKMRLESYNKPAEVELAYFKSNDSTSVAKIQKALSSNASVDSIPGVIREKITESQKHPLLETMAVKESLFGKEPLKADGSFKTLQIHTSEKNADSAYTLIMKVLARRPAVTKTLEEVRPSLEQAFIDSYLEGMMRETAKNLKEKFGFKREEITPPNAREYYESHKNEFTTPPGLVVYHIETVDSLSLVKVMNKSMTLPAFKTLVKSMSVNEATKAQDGLVGEVKENYSLPYGIGMVPELFVEFADKKSGDVSSIIKAPNTGRYHVFYLEKSVPSEVKPFERVEAQVKKQILQSGDFALDSSFVLVTCKGKPAIYERDVLAVQQGIPQQQRRAYTRERLLQYMMDWKAFAMEAEALKLDKSWYFKAYETSTRIGIYNKLFTDSLYSGTLGYSEAQLKEAYDKYGKTVFGGVTQKQIESQLAVLLATPEVILKRQYYFNQEQYAAFPNYEAAKGQVLSSLSDQETRNWMTRFRAKLHENTQTRIYDTTFLPMVDNFSRDSLLVKAHESYKARNLNASIEAWNQLRTLYPDNDSLYARATYELAVVYSEDEKYDFAQREYRAYVALWPKNPDAEKALFSRAFILHENLKQDSAALNLFREFKTEYPKSELMESVDWLIKNIESKGKLAEELLEKIAKQDDSLK
jgi:TolA-binding protein